MPKGGAWSNSNKTRMLSNSSTTIKQGGGNKKAGFPYQVGRGSWTSHHLNTIEPISGNCCNLTKIGVTMKFTRNTGRGIGISPTISMR